MWKIYKSILVILKADVLKLQFFFSTFLFLYFVFIYLIYLLIYLFIQICLLFLLYSFCKHKFEIVTFNKLWMRLNL